MNLKRFFCTYDADRLFVEKGTGNRQQGTEEKDDY
jgi:hypothetical protein